MLVAIVGGGQLGQMLAIAGVPLGHRVRVLDPSPDPPAGRVCEHVLGAYDDPAALGRLVDGADVLTYEFENVPVEAVRALEGRLPVYPPAAALEATQDRVTEKRMLRDLGIPTASFAEVDDRASLVAARRAVDAPDVVLKTRRLGYDGKGQVVLRAGDDEDAAWRDLAGAGPGGYVLEALVPFRRELSIVAARDVSGRTTCYPLVENVHRDGILRTSRAPADVTPKLASTAREYAGLVLDRLGYVGVVAIELFDAEHGLIANEVAPRVHNSGHWTIEGAETGQFENHVRAVTGMPLGPTDPVGHSGMVNLIGSAPPSDDLAAVPGAHLHVYGKDPRPGRKLGHVTVRSADAEHRDALMLKVEALLTDQW
jgi:5-(carboxyamino)imidazole ribonucleotide synthase